MDSIRYNIVLQHLDRLYSDWIIRHDVYYLQDLKRVIQKEARMLQRKCDNIVIGIGLNDIRNGASAILTAERLAELAKQLANTETRVMILHITPQTDNRKAEEGDI